MTEAEIDTDRHGECVVGAEAKDGELLVEFVCVKSTGEVVTDWAFDSGVLSEKRSEIRRQCWDDDIDNKLEDVL